MHQINLYADVNAPGLFDLFFFTPVLIISSLFSSCLSTSWHLRPLNTAAVLYSLGLFCIFFTVSRSVHWGPRGRRVKWSTCWGRRDSRFLQEPLRTSLCPAFLHPSPHGPNYSSACCLDPIWSWMARVMQIRGKPRPHCLSRAAWVTMETWWTTRTWPVRPHPLHHHHTSGTFHPHYPARPLRLPLQRPLENRPPLTRESSSKREDGNVRWRRPHRPSSNDFTSTSLTEWHDEYLTSASLITADHWVSKSLDPGDRANPERKSSWHLARRQQI